jgi:hypothetical protein
MVPLHLRNIDGVGALALRRIELLRSVEVGLASSNSEICA